MNERLKDEYNVIVHETDDMIIFTTNNRDAANLLDAVCEAANVTDNENEYHYQGWIAKREADDTPYQCEDCGGLNGGHYPGC